MSHDDSRRRTGSLRAVLLTMLLYSVTATLAVAVGTDPLTELAVVNLIFGGLLLVFLRNHAGGDGLGPEYYVGAFIVPLVAGAAYYMRHQSAET
ncbi:hypothetical protein [Haloarchaeobius sp. DFWS5]|uniref:hypothetical protein n=1 Tax=Haloarchaeobius sp. DFWS5 TaxID=3446114 RepID=UPI003EBF0D7A